MPTVTISFYIYAKAKSSIYHSATKVETNLWNVPHAKGLIQPIINNTQFTKSVKTRKTLFSIPWRKNNWKHYGNLNWHDLIKTNFSDFPPMSQNIDDSAHYEQKEISSILNALNLTDQVILFVNNLKSLINSLIFLLQQSLINLFSTKVRNKLSVLTILFWN